MYSTYGYEENTKVMKTARFRQINVQINSRLNWLFEFIIDFPRALVVDNQQINLREVRATL